MNIIDYQHSVLRSFMHMVLQTLFHEGVDVEKLNSVLAKENDADPLARVGRIKGSSFIHVVNLMLSQPHPYFSVNVGQSYRPFSFNVLGPLCYSCQTLEENLTLLSRYHHLISTGSLCTFEQHKDLWGIKISASHDAFDRNLLALSWLGIMLAHIRFSIGDTFKPVQITSSLAQPEESHVNYIKNVLQAEVEFGADHTAIYFTQEQLNIKQMGFDAELKIINHELVKEYQQKFEQFELPARIYHCIILLIKKGIFSKTAVAQELGVSTRSLSLKIRKFGINYRVIAEQARMEMAKEYLQNPEMKLIDIAEKLCFSENSNFSRAFKNHTGLTPKNYRTNCITE